MTAVLRFLYFLHLSLLFHLTLSLGTYAFKLSNRVRLSGGGLPFHHSVTAFARPETVERVTSIVATKFEKESKNIGVDCNYRKEFGADNLDEVELLLAIEEEFDLTIPDHDFNDLHTVKDISDYVDRQLTRKSNNS